LNETATQAKAAIKPNSPELVEKLKAEIVRKLTYSLGKNPSVAQPHDWLTAASSPCATMSSMSGSARPVRATRPVASGSIISRWNS
jgi:glucan phosphorylase